MAEALQEAGCTEAWIGAESGSQRVLDAMNKGTSVPEILLARRRLQSVGIRVGFFIQLGYMDEQLEDIIATRELLKAARPDEIGVSVSYPLPGTKFYDLVKAQLREKTHWQESSDLDMMFSGTYRSDFYRRVRDLMHEQVSRQGSTSELDPRVEKHWAELIACESLYRARTDYLPAARVMAS
jgi:anaerobic magnesium-protoporphyrin IX monomethyl ester cyclase